MKKRFKKETAKGQIHKEAIQKCKHFKKFMVKHFKKCQPLTQAIVLAALNKISMALSKEFFKRF